MGRAPKNLWVLIIFLVIGSIFGVLIGQSLEKYIPILNYGQSIGLEPTTIDLAAVTLTFGFILKLNVASIIGFFIALFFYSRL